MTTRTWPPFDAEAFARWRDAHLRTPLPVRPSATIALLRHGLVAFFVLMALAVVASQRAAPTSIGLGALMLAMAAGLFLLFRRAGRRSTRCLDHEGLTRGDGRRLSWRDLQGIETQLALSRRHVHEVLWRITFHFGGEEAWILPSQTTNLDAVLGLLQRMPVPRREKPV